MFQDQYGFVGVVQEDGRRYIVMRRAQKKDDAEGKEMARVELLQNTVLFKVACDFADKKDVATFYYSHYAPVVSDIADSHGCLRLSVNHYDNKKHLAECAK